MGEARHPNHPGELSTEASAAEQMRDGEELGARARAIRVLQRAGVPFLVGGAYAYAHYTGIYRDTKDLDLFVRPADCERALRLLEDAGYRTERTFPHWLAKAFCGDFFIDLIYSSGNGLCRVDEQWLRHAPAAEVLGLEL